MKINNKFNKINFQKKLVATGGFLKNGHPEKCKIYELDPKVDKDYYQKHRMQEKCWDKSVYFKRIDKEMRYAGDPAEKFYTLENSQGKCLVAAITTENYVCNDLEWLVSHPDRNKGEVKIKYAGETMLAYLIKKSQKENRESFEVPAISCKAVNFYKKSQFILLNPHFENFTMPSSKYNKLLNQNEVHTGTKIELNG